MEFLETGKFISHSNSFYPYIWLLRIRPPRFQWIQLPGCREFAVGSFLSGGFLVAEMLWKWWSQNVLGIKVRASESFLEHSRSDSAWPGWPAGDFLEFWFSVILSSPWWISFAKKIGDMINSIRNCVSITRSFPSHPGGNNVDGLPPASSLFWTVNFSPSRSGQCASSGAPGSPGSGLSVESGAGGGFFSDVFLAAETRRRLQTVDLVSALETRKVLGANHASNNLTRKAYSVQTSL